MLKATIISTLFAVTAFQAAADPNPSFDFSVLPPEVAERVAELQTHGDRFKPAIRAIFAEAMKPTWAFGECGHEGGDAVHTQPQS